MRTAAPLMHVRICWHLLKMVTQALADVIGHEWRSQIYGEKKSPQVILRSVVLE